HISLTTRLLVGLRHQSQNLSVLSCSGEPHMNRALLFVFSLLVFVGWLLTPMASFGQATLGIIAGSVADSSEAVVPGATVTVQRTEGGEPRETKTGAAGDYRIESLTPGTYSVKVAAGGFSTAELSNILVNASTTTPVNVTLSVGSTTE